jgi:glycosyltransferase involved in cell wall biosynthesis
MIVHVITNVHNERLLMPYFLRHYSPIADRIYVFDADSDDGTQEIVRECPNAHLIPWDCVGADDQRYMDLNNSAYIGLSRNAADWVFMVDADEFIYHPDLIGTLRQYRECDITIIVPEGFEMVSDHFPTTDGQIYDEVRRGIPGNSETKPCLFNPAMTMGFGAGKHNCEPGYPQPYDRARLATDSGIRMLHMSFLGLKHRQDRVAIRRSRLTQNNIDRGWGTDYLYVTDDEIAAQHAAMMAGAKEIV